MNSHRLQPRVFAPSLVLVAVLLGACGGGDEAEATPTPTETPSRTPTPTSASASGVRTPEPTPIVIAPTISPANKPRLGPLFPAGTTFTRAEAYFTVDIDGTAQSAFFFEVAPRTAVLAPVGGEVSTVADFVIIEDTDTGAHIIISHIDPAVEEQDMVVIGDRVGWTTEADSNIPSELSKRTTPSILMPVNLIVGIAPPGRLGVFGQLDVTLDPDSWWE